MSRPTLATLLVVAAVALTATADAFACENEVVLATNRRVQLVTKAEKDLDEGRFTLASQAVAREYPDLRDAVPGANGLWDRSLRIVALAISRTNGAVKAYGFVAQNSAERAANVAWAIATMRSIAKLRKGDPAALTDLGEMLAREGRHDDEALKILGELAGRDVLTSARGYRALAALRESAGDSAGRDAAVARCKTMAKTADLCRVEDARARPAS